MDGAEPVRSGGSGVTAATFPLVTWSVVNVTAGVNDSRLISLNTSRVSREEVCLPRFDVVNCRLK